MAVEIAQRVKVTIEEYGEEMLDHPVSFVALLESSDAGKPIVSYSLRLESDDFAALPRSYLNAASLSSDSFLSSPSSSNSDHASDSDDGTKSKCLWKCGGIRCVFDGLWDGFEKMSKNIYQRRKQEQLHKPNSASQKSAESLVSWYDDGDDVLPAEEDSPPRTQEEEKSSYEPTPSSEHISSQDQSVTPAEASQTSARVTRAAETSTHTPFAVPSIVSAPSSPLSA